MSMYGAEAPALRATGRRFVESASLLRRHGSELTSLYESSAWRGADADESRRLWNQTSRPALARAERFMADLGRNLIVHADQQEGASAVTSTIHGRHGFAAAHTAVAGAALAGVVERALDAVSDTVDEIGMSVTSSIHDIGELLGRRSGAVVESEAVAAPIDGLRPERFDDPGDGRATLLAAMTGFADERRIARDEIEVRALDNGRYVVVLPGVTDLSDGFDQFAGRVREDGLFGVAGGGRDAYESWSDNDEPTVRKMRYAYEAALRDDTTDNEYSTAVIAAMESAGVPAGADVMIVGHSFGAYTAVDLAVEPTFNVAAGADDGFRVNVTHVVAAGAETDWRFDELPRATSTLVLNNRWDAVYQAENLLHRNASPSEPGHLEAEFWGGRQGYGHDEHNYLDWVGRTDDSDVERWLATVEARYASGGTRVSVPVPDPAVP